MQASATLNTGQIDVAMKSVTPDPGVAIRSLPLPSAPPRTRLSATVIANDVVLHSATTSTMHSTNETRLSHPLPPWKSEKAAPVFEARTNDSEPTTWMAWSRERAHAFVTASTSTTVVVMAAAMIRRRTAPPKPSSADEATLLALDAH